jgi:hypothetical protein
MQLQSEMVRRDEPEVNEVVLVAEVHHVGELFQRAVGLATTGDLLEADAVFADLTSLAGKTHPLTLKAGAHLAFLKGDHTVARDLYRQLLVLREDDHAALANLILLSHYHNDRTAMREYFSRFLKKYPGDTQIPRLRALF